MSTRNPSGAVHPTAFLLLWFILGYGLTRLWPLGIPEVTSLGPLKVGLFATGVALFAWSAIELHRHRTTMEHKHATTTLVTSGPYRLSRNPIYVGLTLILLALSIEGNSVWLMFLTIGFWAAVQWLTVTREEAYLERERVRQWI